MANIFIIGNGFDCSHKLPTKYFDFKKQLSEELLQYSSLKDEKDMVVINELPKTIPCSVHTSRGILRDEISAKKLFYYLIDEVEKAKSNDEMNWEDFEAYLAELPIENLDMYEKDKMFFVSLHDSLSDIDGYFFRWINTIDISNVEKKPKFAKLIKPDDIFISFNYTEVIEEVYDVPDDHVFHFHGKRELDSDKRIQKDMVPIGENNCSLIIGCDMELAERRIEKLKETQSDADKYIGVVAQFIKPTQEIIFNNRDLFEKIQDMDIENIYSIGWSYSKVDLPYVRALCERILENKNRSKITWNIEDYPGEDKIDEYKRLIQKCGYTGEFSTFSIS